MALVLFSVSGPPVVFAATSVSGQTIVVDAGHGGKDPGAIDNGVQEKTVTLAVAQQLAGILRAEGAQVVMTRNSDVNPAPSGNTDDDLQARVNAAQQAHAAAFVSIHANESADTGHSGATTFFGPACGFYSGVKLSPTDVARSYSLAKKVQAAVVARSREHDDGTQSAAFWVLGNPGIPAILVETGFLSNAAEAARLTDPGYQHLMADAIADGVNSFFASGDATGAPAAAPGSALTGCSGVGAKDDRSQTQPAERWLQTTAATPLLSGSDGNAKQFSVLPPSSYLKVLDQKGDFFFVLNPATNGPGWVDGKKVAASDPPPAFQPFWVESFQPTQLWSGSDSKAVNFGPVPVWSFMQVLAPSNTSRFYVRIADTGHVAYVNRADVGPSGPPPPQPAPTKPPAPAPAAAQPASKPAASAPASPSVVVAAGDTASGIAARLGVSLADLLAANHLGAEGLITIGQKLLVPGAASAAAPAPANAGMVTVASGDTLSGLASKLGVSLKSLVTLNHLASPDDIKIGQTLEVPNS